MNANAQALDALLGLGVEPSTDPGLSQTHSESNPEKARSCREIGREERGAASRGELKRVNSALQEQLSLANNRLRKANLAVKSLLIACAGIALGATGVYFWTRAADVRALERAFRVIHYREERAISANAIVLEEWSQKMERLLARVAAMPEIQEDERARRVQTLSALKNQAAALRDGFLKQLQENEKERQGGVGFSYRDPFLKREIQMSEANGGVINLDQLKEEVRANANLDATMRSLEEAMANPVPLLEQVKAQAEQAKKDGTLTSIDLSKGLAGGGLPGAQPVPAGK